MNRREFVLLATRFMALYPVLRFLPGVQATQAVEEPVQPARQGSRRYMMADSAEIYVGGQRIDASMAMETPISAELLQDAMMFSARGGLTIVWEDAKYWSVEEDRDGR